MCGFHLSFFVYFYCVCTRCSVVLGQLSFLLWLSLWGQLENILKMPVQTFPPPTPNRVQEGHASQITASFSTFDWPEPFHSENAGRQTAVIPRNGAGQFPLQFLSRLFFFFFFIISKNRKCWGGVTFIQEVVSAAPDASSGLWYLASLLHLQLCVCVLCVCACAWIFCSHRMLAIVMSRF